MSSSLPPRAMATSLPVLMVLRFPVISTFRTSGMMPRGVVSECQPQIGFVIQIPILGKAFCGAAHADLQRIAVLNQAAGIAGNALLFRPYFRRFSAQLFGNAGRTSRCLLYKIINFGDMNRVVAKGIDKTLINLGNDDFGALHGFFLTPD